MKKLIAVCLSVIFLNMVADNEPPACRKFEEKLYLSLLLNNNTTEKQIDSLKGCMLDSPALYLAMGKFYDRQDNNEKSEEQFLNVINDPRSTRPEKAEAYFYLALTAYYRQAYDLSIERSHKALEFGYSEPSSANNNMGIAYYWKNDYRNAIRCYKEAVRIDPENLTAISNLAGAYGMIYQNDMKLRYRIMADSIAGGENALHRSNLISALEDEGRQRASDSLLFLAINKFPDNKHIVTNYAAYLNRNGQYEEALVYARKLRTLSPSSSSDWFDIAHTYQNAGIDDSAFYFYKVCIKMNPSSNAYNNLGLIYKTRGKFEKANECYDKAMALDSGSHYPVHAKVNNYLWMHDYEKAYAWGKLFLERFPNQDFDLTFGYVAMTYKKYREAIPYFFKHLSRNPNDDRAFNNLGRCYAQMQMTDSAFYCFNKALAYGPDNSYIYHNRAALYYDLGKFDLACADLQTSMDKEYTWVIDEKLEKMRQQHCPSVNTQRKVMIFEYRGNEKEHHRFKFIELSDSQLNESITKEADLSESFAEKTENLSSAEGSVMLYPNPTNGKFFVESTSGQTEELTVKIFNEEGKLLQSGTMQTTSKKEFEVKVAGTYVVMILDQTSVISAKKLIITK